MKVAIVEDEIRIREGLTRLLKKISPDCEIMGEAENGVKGLALIEETHPDLIITDIKMPQMDGLEMLSLLHERNIKAKVIVLSAYSEFAYAQQAIKLGISEYLLKPIALDSFAKSIRTIEAQIAHDRLLAVENPQKLRSLDHVLYGILYSALPIDDELRAFLRSAYGMDPDGDFAVMDLYLGAAYGDRKERISAIVKRLMEQSGRRYHPLHLPQGGEFLLLLHSIEDIPQTERYIRDVIVPQVRQAAGDASAFGLTSFTGLALMKESVGTLRSLLDWSIVLDADAVIACPEIAKIQPATLSYPIDLEKRAKSAVCAFDYAVLGDVFGTFSAYLHAHIYSPSQIKETVVRFLWAVITILKEIDFTVYERIEQQALLERVMSAVTWTELQAAVAIVSETLSVRDKEQTLSLSVRRAKSMVYEGYQEGITLDEIAGKLGITPEYLGTQFHKEVGESFNAYIKNCRVKKAKELLIGSDMKLYKIASAVGYTDPKYFSRVFREATGQLPAEYRSLHK